MVQTRDEKVSDLFVPFDPAPMVRMKRAYQKMVQFLLQEDMIALRREYMESIRENTATLYKAFLDSGVATPEFQLKERISGQTYIMIQAYIDSARISALTAQMDSLISFHNLPLTQRQSIGFNLSALTWFLPEKAAEGTAYQTVFFRWVVGGEPLQSRVSDRDRNETSLIQAYTNFLQNLKTKIQEEVF